MKNDKLEAVKTRVFSSANASSADLEVLLASRANKEIDFWLIDIREVMEYTNQSIVGTDYLFPTTLLHIHIETLEALKNDPIILYCRTGNRTGHVLGILKQQMGFTKIAHLTDGIVAYRGEKCSNAKIPNKI